MRGTLVLTIILGSLPFCLQQPWIGVLMFSWISYMNPHRYAWGFARTFPVALVVALVTLLGLLVTKDKWRLPRDPATVLIICLWLLFCVTTPFAFNQSYAWAQLEQVSKIFLMTFVTIILINTPTKFRYLLLVIALSIGLIGLKGGIWAITSGGQNRVYGPAGSFIADNNDIALALNMALPLLLGLANGEQNRWLRRLLRVCLTMSVVAIVFTYSRGGFLALVLVGFMMLIKAKYKALAFVGLFFGVLALAVIVPSKWTDRMHTIQQGSEDASANGRINAWKTGVNIALARPLIGGGFGTFIPEVFARYSPQPWNIHDVHSNYFEMLGEQGFIGFGLYMILLIYCLLMLSRMKWMVVRDPALNWARYYPDMLQTSILAYMLGGAFLGRAYFDFFYHLVAAIVILGRLLGEAKQSQAEPVPLRSRPAYLHPAVEQLRLSRT